MTKSPRNGVSDGAADSPLVTLCCPSPNVEPRKDGRTADLLLLHYTGMEDPQAALTCLSTAPSKVSCHYMVEEDGRITQIVPESLRAWHAGVSFWAGEEDINSCSIGIEIQNAGHDFGYPDFPQAQMLAVEALCIDILARNPIPPERVLAHSDVAPARKIDPGEKFDWARLARAGIGLWVEPVAISDDGARLEPGDEGPAVRSLQEDLRLYGYGLDATGTYDETTRLVVAAFQRHFRPARVDGLADRSTRKTLARLLDALKSA